MSDGAAGHTLREVCDLLGVTPARVRGLVRSGAATPTRGPGGELRFSFADVASLRSLLGVPARRVRAAFVALERRGGQGARVCADEGEVVVRDGAGAFDPDSGQARLEFGAQDRPIALHGGSKGREIDDRTGAERVYRSIVERNPQDGGAWLALGTLCHDARDAGGAAEHYRRACDALVSDPIPRFNLGTALEDLGRSEEALIAYADALRVDPSFADAHFNAARLCERAGDQLTALRHLKAYRRLTGAHN